MRRALALSLSVVAALACGMLQATPAEAGCSPPLHAHFDTTQRVRTELGLLHLGDLTMLASPYREDIPLRTRRRWARRNPDSRLARRAALRYGSVSGGTLAEPMSILLPSDDPRVPCTADLPGGTKVSRQESEGRGHLLGADWTFTLQAPTTVCDEPYNAGDVLEWTSLTVQRQPEWWELPQPSA